VELTRRDAIAALAAAGITVGGGAAVLARDGRDESDGDTSSNDDAATDGTVEGPIEEGHLSTLVAAASVLYPSEVDRTEAFVETFVRGRASEQPDHARGVAEAATYLDDYARAWRDRGFADLDPDEREETLREMGADTADPVPDGSDVERVRYYVVNELLYALYSSPTGGELVGIENPQGHPGGVESYRRGPRR